VYKELFFQEPEPALGYNHDYDYYMKITDRPDYFEWGEVVRSSDDSASSRADNLLSLWLRPTIFYSLDCESILSRDEAFDTLGKQIEILAFFHHFWWIGTFIILLVLIPLFFFDA
jgi:hypothetical protein